MAIQKPMKVFYLNGLNAAANYPVLTYCPASGQQVSSWRLMTPEGGCRKR